MRCVVAALTALVLLPACSSASRAPAKLPVARAATAVAATAERPAPSAPGLTPVADLPKEVPSLGKGLDRAQVRPVLAKSSRLAAGCHALAYSGDESAVGTATVDFRVRPDGSVVDVEVTLDGLKTELSRCLARTFEKLRFPAASGETRVSKRLRFR